MDDLVILDLLDCPICLEKLDATAKVLPCQHTFCQPCLQRILKARKELRCPECRTLAHCTIEELPANLLLVRLLEGMKNGKGLMRKSSLQRMGGLFAHESFRRNREQRSNHNLNSKLLPKTRMPSDEVPCAKAVLSHKGQSARDSPFNKGDIIILHKQLDENCYRADMNRGSGGIPVVSVKNLKKVDQPPALCRALYDFDLKDKDKAKNKDCLKFSKDEIISVIRRVDDNWAEGKLGDRVGIFPLLFVELNSTAKQMLESNKYKRKDANNGTVAPTTMKKSPSNIASIESATIQRVPERRKSQRQFLITNALNTLNKIVHSPSGRRTPEISTPILISSSNTAVIEKAKLLSNAPNQANGSFFYATLGSQATGPSITAVASGNHNILAKMYIAFHPYTARGADEINLQRGEGIRVLGRFQEGWLRGISLVTGKVGIFPSNCVQPVYSGKSTNYSDPRLPSYQSKWISSNVSVSSQSSVSETGISRPVRPFYVPNVTVEPVKKSAMSSSALVPVTLRRRNSGLKKGLGTCPKVPSISVPAYSPDLSPIENLWGIVKRKMRDTRLNNADKLKAAIKATWASITPLQYHRLTASMPLRIDAVIHAKGAPTNFSNPTAIPAQKPLQSNPVIKPMGTISRSPSTASQPQQIIINSAYSNVGASADTRTRPNSMSDFANRPADYRRFSTASSAYDPREPLSRTNSMMKPPISAPASILVKPDTPKSGSDKVKTVRFMNFSPPASKRHSAFFDEKNEEVSSQNVIPESSQAAQSIMTVPLRPNPGLIQKTENRTIQKLKSPGNDTTPSLSQSTLSFPKKVTVKDNANRGSTIYQAQEVLST
ncbi:E3 ubiquitin-protein ligase SH3RF2 [Gastrophryne carolinensis]